MKVEIDLGAIVRNYRRVAKSSGKDLIAMCKANAYGHGAAQVVRALPASTIGVATETEGIPIRDLGREVLVTAPSFSALPLCKRYGLIPLIGDFALARRAVDCGLERCRIKVNSGMNRLGFTGEKECYEAALYLTRAGVTVEGADTHYREDGDENILVQNERFLLSVAAVRAGVREGGSDRALTTSVTGSGALYASEFDYLRVGLALYGYHTGYATAGLPLEQAMRVTSEIVGRRSLPVGETLGYSSLPYKTTKPTKAYVVLGGYGDGVLRAEVGREVIAAGRRLSIATVSMDTFIMVSDRIDLPVGARVIILSKGVDAAYIASRRGTIPYEVLVGYDTSRADRSYVE